MADPTLVRVLQRIHPNGIAQIVDYKSLADLADSAEKVGENYREFGYLAQWGTRDFGRAGSLAASARLPRGQR